MTIAVDGMRLNNLCGQGQQRLLSQRRRRAGNHVPDRVSTAEVGSGGLRINMVPKDGGTFAGTFLAAGGALQADNRTEVEPFIPVAPASTTSSRSTRRSGDRSRGTGSGSTLPTGQLLRAVRHGRRVRRRHADPDHAHAGKLQRHHAPHVAGDRRDKFRVYLDRQMNGEFYNNASSDESPEEHGTPRAAAGRLK